MNRSGKTTVLDFSRVLLALGIFVMPFSFAHAAGSAVITAVSPSSTIDVGTSVNLTVVATGFTNPYYQVSDSFSGTSVGYSDIGASDGYFSWDPIQSDVGNHYLTFKVTDSLGDSATVTQEITVEPSGTPELSIQYLSPGQTIAVGQRVTFFALASDYSATPEYSVSDNFNGSSVVSSDISQAGEFIWTPTSSDVGTHILTITGQNNLGNLATIQQQIVVTGSSSTATTTSSPITIQSSSSANTSVGQQVSFTAAATGFTNPTYTLTDSFPGSSISNADINSSGYFSWTPLASDVGTHTLTINVSDSSGHSSTITQVITVQSASVAIENISTGSTSSVTSSVATSSATSSFDFTTPLTPGLQSQDVTNLQNLLTSYGLYSGPITGYYGSLTVAAVKSFQTAHNLPAVGSVGPLTLASLKALNGAPSVTTSTATTTATTDSSTPSYDFTTLLKLGSKGAAVTALQNKLTSLGDYSAPITGYFGSLTETALKEFQTAQSISPVGYTGPATRAALNQ